jgi:DNA-binding LytR/AlgR family response regulator
VRDQLSTGEPERHLIVGGERFNLRGLLHIEAREHHVHLTFEDNRKLFRARLGDIVAQTRIEDGFQPHRSWWVARDSVITPERKGGRLILRLRDDTEVPVARTRIEEVEQWLQTHITGL